MTNEGLKLKIYSPERILLDGKTVSEVTLTGSEGQIQILPGHASMVGTHETGLFGFKEPSGTEKFGFISTGFFETSENEVSIMAETLELQDEIDVERAQQAQKRAEEALQGNQAFQKNQLKLQRALIRQQVARKG